MAISGSVSADMGIYPYAKVHIPLRADKDYVKLGVGGGIAFEGRLLGGVNGVSSPIAALSWAFEVFASGRGEYRVQSAELFTSSSTLASLDFLRAKRFPRARAKTAAQSTRLDLEGKPSRPLTRASRRPPDGRTPGINPTGHDCQSAFRRASRKSTTRSKGSNPKAAPMGPRRFEFALMS